jgi:transposase
MARGKKNVEKTQFIPIGKALKDGLITAEKATEYYDKALEVVELKLTDGLNQEEIADQLGLAAVTVRGYLRKPPCWVKQHGERTEANKKSAKKESLKERRDLVVKYAKMTKTSNYRKMPKYPSAQSIVAVLKAEHGIEVSYGTVRNDLIAAGLQNYRRPTRAYHSGHTPARQAFCEAFEALGINVRKQLFFCDESVIAANDSTCKTQWATKRSKVLHRSKLRPQNVPNIAIWAFIGHNYKSKLTIFEKKKHQLTRRSKNGKAGDWVEQKGNVNVTSDLYIEQCLRPHVAKLKTGILQQDGASSHNSVAVTTFMRNNGIRRLESVIEDGWPSSSPDFNPIETIWAILKRRISEKFGIAKDVAQLRDFAQRAWATITIAEVNATIKACEEEIAAHA